jgi:nucleotide-binding universal stress UspA family protein
MFKRILVPIDFSPPSDAALEYARSVAARYGASLHLLHVAEDPIVRSTQPKYTYRKSKGCGKRS